MKARFLLIMIAASLGISGCASNSTPPQKSNAAAQREEEETESPGLYWARRDIQDRIDHEKEKNR